MAPATVRSEVCSSGTKIKPEQVLPNPDEQTKLCETLQDRIDGIKGETAEIEQQQENLMKQIRRTKSDAMRDRYEADVLKLVAHASELKTTLSETQQRLSEAEHNHQSFSKWQRDLTTMTKKIEGNPELRQPLNNHLKQFIERIDIYPIGDTENNRHEGYLEAIEDEVDFPEVERKKFYKFSNELLQRANTKEGRFVRLVFKTKIAESKRKNVRPVANPHVGENHRVDLVPKGSLAFGLELIQTDKRRKTGWRFVSPGIGRLWEEFQKC